MNFVPGKIMEKGGSLFFCGAVSAGIDGLILAVDQVHAKELATWLGKPLVLGLRPEDVEDRGSEADPAHCFEATVEVIEATGAETYLYLRAGPQSLVARSRRQLRAAPGQVITMVAHMGKAHYFEAIDPAPYEKSSGELDLESWHAACRLVV